jgi:hypothetical protein
MNPTKKEVIIKMNDKEWLEKAIEFELAREKDINPWTFGDLPEEQNNIMITLKKAGSSNKWSVMESSNNVLNKENLRFECQRSPSNRDEDYLNTYAFDSKEEACESFIKWKEVELLVNEARDKVGLNKEEKKESELAALKSIVYIYLFRMCIVNKTENFSFGNAPDLIYPEKEYNKELEKINNPEYSKVVEELFDKLIKPIQENNNV